MVVITDCVIGSGFLQEGDDLFLGGVYNGKVVIVGRNAVRLLDLRLVNPGYDAVIKCSHAFNLLDEPTYNQQWFNVYFAPATDRWLTAIRSGVHTHDGDPLTDIHVKATHLRKVRLGDEDDDQRTKYVLIKGDDGGRIDAAVADVLAYEAAMTMPEATPVREFASAWG